jgi:uncharacterized membrane protein YraQ (UPF0718 family)
MPADFPSKAVSVMLSSWRLIGQLWYYLAVGILLAAWLDQAVSFHRLRRLFDRGKSDIVLAALAGATSPLCTYGTVPVLVQLLRHGVSPASPLTFLVASSLMNPQLFVLMLGGLGLEMALAQLLGVFILSLTVGIIAGRWEPLTLLNQRTLFANPASNECEIAVTDSTFSWSRFLSQVVSLTESVGLYFVVGIIIAAAIEVFVPSAWVVKLLGEEHWYSVLIAGSLGVPFYACGGGAIPWIKVLLNEGMSRGAALAFFLAGPATRITALAALATVLSRRVLILYVAFVLVGAVGLGYLLNILG